MAAFWPWKRSSGTKIPSPHNEEDLRNSLFFQQIQALLGQEPYELSLYERACTHRSVADNEQVPHNERLEFLGDAILSACVAQYLFEHFPEEEEGSLSLLRSKLVSRRNLNDIGLQMGLPDILRFKASRGTQAKSVYGNALEALIGALFLDKGYPACFQFVEQRFIADFIDVGMLFREIDSYKSHLLEWGQKQRKRINFWVEEKTGHSHAPEFLVLCAIEGQKISSGKGGSKKGAEEEAAKAAYETLGLGHGRS